MIDTVVLLLTKDMFSITDPTKFKPSATWALKDTQGNQTSLSKQNPTKKELRNGFYKPRLTLFNRINKFGGKELVLKIELSLPKLMFGNNFAELRFKDFAPLIQKLVAVLADMGIAITQANLALAPVLAIHYSKNICLTDGSTPNFYINKIKEANIKLSLDVSHTEYRNDGHGYKWHANYYEVAFYDKIRDLEKAKISKRRAMEHDNELQIDLLKKLQKRTTKFELLRMEVRLNKRVKIQQLFRKLSIKADLTFKKLFKPAISKKVLLHYIAELESKRPKLLDYKARNSKALLVDLIFNNPTIGPKQILQLYGFKQALDIMTPRELRMMLSRYSARSWYRLIADANKIQLPQGYDHFKVIREQLMKFEAITKYKLT